MSVDHDPNVQEDESNSPLTPVEAESFKKTLTDTGAEVEIK